MIKHPIEPVYNEGSRILILGSFPSVKSREQGFFYGHSQNRFWRILAALLDEKCPDSVEEKREFLLKNHIAVWDVIASCDIDGSMDNTIRNVAPNDLSVILENSDIRRIFVNGKTAKKLYDRYLYPKYKIEAVLLPSSSPANAAWNMERLVKAWSIIIK